MKLKDEVIARMKGYDMHFNGELKRLIMDELKVSKNTVYKHIRDNQDNGELTKVGVLMLIADKLDMEVLKMVEP